MKSMQLEKDFAQENVCKQKGAELKLGDVSLNKLSTPSICQSDL